MSCVTSDHVSSPSPDPDQTGGQVPSYCSYLGPGISLFWESGVTLSPGPPPAPAQELLFNVDQLVSLLSPSPCLQSHRPPPATCCRQAHANFHIYDTCWLSDTSHPRISRLFSCSSWPGLMMLQICLRRVISWWCMTTVPHTGARSASHRGNNPLECPGLAQAEARCATQRHSQIPSPCHRILRSFKDTFLSCRDLAA